MKGTCLGSQNKENVPPSVCVKAPHNLDLYTTGGVTEHKNPFGVSRCLTVPDVSDFELIVPKQDVSKHLHVELPPLYAERSITGHGQERGGVQALLTNPSPTSSIDFVYFEALPWFMKPYLHTLKIRSDNSSLSASIKDMYYRPGVDRNRGSQLELHITVPPATKAVLTYQFEKAFLRYTEYPPDANRGRDVAPAVIRLSDPVQNQNQKDRATSYLRTTSLMLPLPTPDFSMPYNVIILTSTVIAMAFGTMYNLLVRRFVGTDEAEGKDLKTRIRAAIAWIKGKFAKEGLEKKTQ